MNKIIDLFRIREWFGDVFVWYIAIIILTLFTDRTILIKTGLIFILYHFVMMCLIYYFNSYADLKQDRIAGKKNALLNLPTWVQKIIFVFIVGLFVLVPLIIGYNVLFLSIVYLNLFLSIFYSFKPIRFKERGFTSIVVASLIQGALAYLAFIIYLNLDVMVYLGLLLWIFFIEASDDLTHQFDDYVNDKKAKVKTYLVNTKLKMGIKVNYLLILLSILVLIPYLFVQFYLGLLYLLFLGGFCLEKLNNFGIAREELKESIKKIIKNKNY